MNFEPLSKKYDAIASAIVIAAYSVHKELGPGLLVSSNSRKLGGEKVDKGFRKH